MYIIVVGAGDIGTPLIDIATRSGNEVVVIETDTRKADAIASQYDCLVLNADATTKETLADAGAERADAIISTTDQDATNVMVCLLSEEFDIPAITSVVHTPEHMDFFRRIEVNTVQNPQQLIAGHLYRAVARPAIVDYMRIGEEAEVFEITVTEDAPIAGKTLTEVGEEALLFVSLAWVGVSVTGTIPYLLAGVGSASTVGLALESPSVLFVALVNALFESTSGFTTTGRPCWARSRSSVIRAR